MINTRAFFIQIGLEIRVRLPQVMGYCYLLEQTLVYRQFVCFRQPLADGSHTIQMSGEFFMRMAPQITMQETKRQYLLRTV
ncbi:hypothetical protein P378_01925 [Desulforamulus profundi]|uniref:Uncharacterized protein n=1 Tax=Desulforamulus profundi TaxID=1383067 RepID=A0A2C6MH87_9FIRM|nr:hypothetical protein [Desulforamulus profundi]PHJ39628.1 hypothetical protein P378_01925 [Desulforamulus profundi]